MAVYFDTKLALPPSATHSNLTWHPSYDIAAVSSFLGAQGKVT